MRSSTLPLPGPFMGASSAPISDSKSGQAALRQCVTTSFSSALLARFRHRRHRLAALFLSPPTPMPPRKAKLAPSGSAARVSSRKKTQTKRAKDADPPRKRTNPLPSSGSSDTLNDNTSVSAQPKSRSKSSKTANKNNAANTDLNADADDDDDENGDPSFDERKAEEGISQEEGFQSEDSDPQPKKRRKTSGFRSLYSHSRSFMMSARVAGKTAVDETPATVSVTLNFDVFTPAEILKPEKKRQPLASAIITLPSDTPFYRFARILLEKVTRVAKLGFQPEAEDVGLHYQIPRVVFCGPFRVY
ncbi:hypothetical protein R3P38DRAFT_2814076 [Favolaschia claudopus]|uniref:Uncharacterized protein n=1 Tax=Favolaschia claudopus TaxID=2862362 RepID=A0AAV9Z3X9_9AGAR